MKNPKPFLGYSTGYKRRFYYADDLGAILKRYRRIKHITKKECYEKYSANGYIAPIWVGYE